MKALVLGAGYATRLYPLTKERPKPLLPIGGVPILERICGKLQGIRDLDRIYLVTNHRFAGHYYSWLRDAKDQGRVTVPLEIFDDLTTSNDDRLGAIGDIEFVLRAAKVDDELLVVAGDNLFEFGLQDFVDFARPKGAGVCVKDVGRKELATLYGVVETDAGGRVLDFEEKPPSPASTLVSIGVYYYGRAHLGRFAEYLAEGQRKDAPGYFVQWIKDRIPLYAWRAPGTWYDIGDIDSYNQANEQYLK